MARRLMRLLFILTLFLSACGATLPSAPTATLPPVAIPTLDPTPTAEPDPCIAQPLPHVCFTDEPLNPNPDLRFPIQSQAISKRVKAEPGDSSFLVVDEAVDVWTPGPPGKYEWVNDKTQGQHLTTDLFPYIPPMEIAEGLIKVSFTGLKNETLMRLHWQPVEAGQAYFLQFALDTSGLKPTGVLTYAEASERYAMLCRLRDADSGAIVAPELFPAQPFAPEPGVSKVEIAFRPKRDMVLIFDCGWTATAATLEADAFLISYRIEPKDWSDVQALSEASLTIVEF